MLEVLVSAAALIVTLGILVTFHEYGHFWAARRCGVKVLRFSVGFGRAVRSWTGKDGVEYVIAPIPLGGYVKMLGQEDVRTAEPVPEELRERSFACKPLRQRAAIIAAGPAANFLLAAVVYWTINVVWGASGVAPVVEDVAADSAAAAAGLAAGDEIVAVDGRPTAVWRQVSLEMLRRMGETGELALTVADRAGRRQVSVPIEDWMADAEAPDPLTELGIVRFRVPAVIGDVLPGGAAEAAGLRPGDRVTAVDGEPVGDWSRWVERVRASPELELEVAVERAGGGTVLRIRPEAVRLDDGAVVGRIGAAARRLGPAELAPPERRRSVRYGPLEALGPALAETWDKTVFVLDSIGKMIAGLISTRNIGGPITIAQVAGEAATYGPEVYLGFLALLSISLGVLNLLPIPALDGGHLLYCAVEAVTRRPLPDRVQAWGLQLGLLVITGIMALAIYNDVTRLL